MGEGSAAIAGRPVDRPTLTANPIDWADSALCNGVVAIAQQMGTSPTMGPAAHDAGLVADADDDFSKLFAGEDALGGGRDAG